MIDPGNFKDLKAYSKAFDMAMDIYQISKAFPKAEQYSLTDQIRRSSRSICSCIAEAYRKDHYPAYFVSKVSDSDMENSETQVWLDFALSCDYINTETYNRLISQSEEIGKLLHHMITHPEKYKRRNP